jgi:hypothetical protein
MILGSNLGRPSEFKFFLSFYMLCIGFIREFQTYNFLSDLTAHWAKAYVPSSLVGNGSKFAPRPSTFREILFSDNIVI